MLGFHGLSRISKLLDLQAIDVTVHTDCLKILVKSSRIDISNTGKATKSISEAGGITSPTVWICRYFASARIDTNSSV